MADNTQPALLDAIRAQLHNLEETIGGLNWITMEAPGSALWDRVRE